MAIQKNTGGSGVNRAYYNYNMKTGSLTESVRPSAEGGKWGKVDHGNQRIDGKLVGVYIKEEEYENKPRAALIVVLADEAANVEQHIGVTCWTAEHESSSAAVRLMARLNACQLNDPIVLQCNVVKEGDTLGDGSAAKSNFTNFVVYRPVFGKGNSVQPVFTNGTKDAPTVPYVKVGNKNVPDKTDLNAEMEKLGKALCDKFPFDPKTGMTPAMAEGGHDDAPDLGGLSAQDVADAANQQHQRQRA